MDENNFYETEVSPKEILKKMKTNVYENNFKNTINYISSDYLLNRSSLFSLIRKISNKMGFKSQTYFLSIYYLDILFLKNKKIDCNYKTLGLACLLLSAKYIEIDTRIPNLAVFIKAYNMVVGYKYFISVTDLFYAEVLTCKMLEYKLNYYTIYDFDSFFFGHGIIKMEQLKEINNGNFNQDNNLFEINSSNSIYIKKILEKIYRKSRYYLELIVNDSQICLKYNSLLISIFIMKKSIEEILFEEQRINKYDIISLNNFTTKNTKCFKEIMKELYQIEYESMEGYLELISDTNIIKLFQKDKKGEFSPIKHSKNKDILNNSKNSDKIKTFSDRQTISDYSHINDSNEYPIKYINPFSNNSVLNSSLNRSQILRKFNKHENDNGIDDYGALNQNRSNNEYRFFSKSKPKKYDIISNILDSSNVSSSKDLNKLNIRRKYQNLRVSRALSRHSDANCIRYLQRLTSYNDFGRRRIESNSVSKNNNLNLSRIPKDELIENNENNLDNDNTIDNNNINIVKNDPIKIESPVRFNKPDGYNNNKYMKMKKLRDKFYNQISINKKDVSTSLLNNSNANTFNTINTIGEFGITNMLDEENNSKNYGNISKRDIKPYFRKVIKNTSNYSTNKNITNNKNTNTKCALPQNTKEVSNFSTTNNDGTNEKSRLFKSINLENLNNNYFNSSIYNKKEEAENENENKLDNKKEIDTKENIEENESRINRMRQRQIFNSKNFSQKTNMFNIRKNIYMSITENDEDQENRKTDDKIIEENDDKKENNDKISNNQTNKYSLINLYMKNRKETHNNLIKKIFEKSNREKYDINDFKNDRNENLEIKGERTNKTVENESINDNKNENIRTKYKRRTTRNEVKNEINEDNKIMKSIPNNIPKRKYFRSYKKPKDLTNLLKESKNNSIENSKTENNANENKNQLNTEGNSINNTSINKNIKINENKYQSLRHKYIKKEKEDKETEKKDKGNNEKIKEEKDKTEKKIKNEQDNSENDNIKVMEHKARENNILNMGVNKAKKNIFYKIENDNLKESNDVSKIKEGEELVNRIKKEYNSNSNDNTNSDLKEIKRNFNHSIKKYIKNDEKNNLFKRRLKYKNDTNPILNKTSYPSSSIFKLLNRTKNIDKNNELTKEELNLELQNNYLFNSNKRNLMNKTIITIENDDNNKDKDNNDIIDKEILIPKDRTFNTINSIHSSSNRKNSRIIQTYQYRNLFRNKFKKNIDVKNQELNINSNNTSNTIVINNNININFNNKIPTIPGRYFQNKPLKRTTTEVNRINNSYINDNNYINENIHKENSSSHHKNIIEKYQYVNPRKINDDNHYKGMTIRCINNNKNNDIESNGNSNSNSISSLIHRLPFYKKTLENNRRFFSKERPVEVNNI